MRSEFNAVVQPRAEQIAALSPAADDVDLPPDVSAERKSSLAREVQIEPEQAPEAAAPIHGAQVAAPAERRPETPEEAAERERRYREIFGIPEPKVRRRWRR